MRSIKELTTDFSTAMLCATILLMMSSLFSEFTSQQDININGLPYSIDPAVIAAPRGN